MYKIAIVVDRSASMMGTMRLQANAVCATMMALARMGLDAATCVLTFGMCGVVRSASVSRLTTSERPTLVY
jgi:hypothetical protein